MAEQIDCRGLRCPQPILKLAIKANSLAAGSTVEMLADCPTFQSDVEKWCKDCGKVLVSCVDMGQYRQATIQL